MTFRPIHIGTCRCGLHRGHDGLCDGEVEMAPVREKLTNTPWHAMREELDEQFGEHMGTWLAKRIGKEIRGKECISHFSVAEVPAGVRSLHPALHMRIAKHQEARSGGCCGSFDGELTHYESKRVFVFGFNHGH